MPSHTTHTLDFFSRSPEQTRRIGQRLGGALQAGDVICLQGDLGAGKTTFAQGIAQGWGSLDPVSSPTFILVNVYRRADDTRLFHMLTVAEMIVASASSRKGSVGAHYRSDFPSKDGEWQRHITARKEDHGLRVDS